MTGSPPPVGRCWRSRHQHVAAAWYMLWPLPLAVITRDRRLLWRPSRCRRCSSSTRPRRCWRRCHERAPSGPERAAGRACRVAAHSSTSDAVGSLRRRDDADLLGLSLASHDQRRGAQVHVNHRLSADLATWRGSTGHDYRNLAIEQRPTNPDTTREVHLRQHLARGAQVAHAAVPDHDRSDRATGAARCDGGYYLPRVPPGRPTRGNRYGCFGAAAERSCARPRPPRPCAATGRASRRHERRAPAAGRRGLDRARAAPRRGGRWPRCVLLAAALRFATLGEQSFWYDEAFTPVHVLHAEPRRRRCTRSSHTENTPPLWYVLIWGWSRVFGTGAVALRSLVRAGRDRDGAAWPGRSGASSAGRRTAIVLRRDGRGQPAVRVVLAGGARLRAVRAAGGAVAPVLPARASATRRRGALAASPLPARWRC